MIVALFIFFILSLFIDIVPTKEEIEDSMNEYLLNTSIIETEYESNKKRVAKEAKKMA